MWNRFSGESYNSKNDLSSQNTWRNDLGQRHPADRSPALTSAISNKKSSFKTDDQDSPGFKSTSTRHSSAVQGQYPRAASASTASSYATASGNTNGEPYTSPGVAGNVSLADEMPRSSSSRSSREQEQARKTKDKKRGKARNFDGGDQGIRKRQLKDERQMKDESLRKSEEGLDDKFGTSRGSDSIPNRVASSGFPQFPGQYDEMISGHNGATHDHPSMSSHVQDQFPGQFPTQSTAPYRPPLAASEGGPGLAAEYYGDVGQSVAEQPGNRTDTPSLIVGAEPHLQPALAVAAPPPEPSASGAVGAAASFFSGEFEDDEAVAPHGHQDLPTYIPGLHRPNANHHSASAPVIPTIGGTGIISAASYSIEGQTSTHQQRPDHESSIGGGAYSEYSSIAASRPPSEMSNPHHSNVSRPSKPGKQSSQSSFNPTYAAGIAGAAGLAGAAYEHNHHSSDQNLFSPSHYSTTSMPQRHRNRGPLSAVVDFFKDPEGVAQFEEYSQIIGVCRHCFAPGSSPRDAPRKHFYGRRRSNERYGGSTRVDKDSRYYSSENEGRRKNKSWLATGLAGYGLVKTGESLMNGKDENADTYVVRSGHFPPDGRDRGVRRRTRSKEPLRTEIIGESSSGRKGTRDHIANGTERTTYSTSRHSETRSRSRDRKTGMTETAISAALGTSVVTSNSRLQSLSPRGTTVKSKHMNKAPSPERRHKTKKKKRDRGFLSFGNGSSSSSSVDLAYTGSQTKHRSSKRSTGKSNDDKKAEAALLGLGAAAAALALNNGRQGHRKKGVKEYAGVKETKVHDTHGSTHGRRPKKSIADLDDELWESAAEDDYESINSDLAYGGTSRKNSQESLSSESSGTNKWFWRWGSKKNRKLSPPRRKSSDHSSFHTVANAAGADLTDAAFTSPDQRQGSAMTSTSSLPLQHVYPVPTSDPTRFDVRPEAPIASSNSPTVLSRPEAVPIQHPQPITPVSAAIYSSSTAYDHSYSAPTGAAASSQIPYYHYPGTSDARHSTLEASVSGSLPRSEPRANDMVHDFGPKRRNTSPAKYGADSISSSMGTRRRSSAKDDSSAVRFELTEEQEERYRRERRQKRKEDKERRKAEEQEQTEKAQRDSKEELFEKRGPKAKPETGPERSGKSWVGPGVAGIVGAAMGSAVATEISRREETREERRERRRRERDLEDEEDALNRSERRRRQRERDEQEAAIEERVELPDKIFESSEHVDHQGRSPKRKEMSVWQEAASAKRSSSHENYGAFFTPVEVLNKSSDQVKITSANADADIDFDQVPQIVTVKPKRIRDLSGSPEFTSTDNDDKVDPSRPSFPWQVPKLRLVEPTPPSSRASTPNLQPKDAGDEPFEESRRDQSPSKVKWADDQNREYAIIAPKEDCDETIEPNSREVNDTYSVDLSRDTHERDLPNDKMQSHRDYTMESSSALYGEDVGFAATLAASAEDAGFDPSIVTNNPAYRRRDSPPGSYERSVPGAFDVEDELGLEKKEWKRKEKVSRRQGQSDGSNKRDDDTIVKDIISQVKEYDSQLSDRISSETLDDVWDSAKQIENTKLEQGEMVANSGNKSSEKADFASEALNTEIPNTYGSPTEDVRSITSFGKEAESGRKSRRDAKWDRTDLNNAASFVITPSTAESSDDLKSKSEDGHKASIWDRVLGKSSDKLPQENVAKVVAEPAIAEGFEAPEKKKKRTSKERKVSRDWDDEHNSKEQDSIEGITPQLFDEVSQNALVKSQGTRLPSTFSDAGSVAKYLDRGVQLEQGNEKQSESFLGMRPEPPPPPDTGAEGEERSSSLKMTSLSNSPHADSEIRSREFSDAEISNPMTALPSSPTSVPLRCRPPARSSSTVRSLSQNSLPTSQSSADKSLKQRKRPHSTDFKSSNEIRPLMLVERHRSSSSRATLRSLSVDASEERQHRQKGDFELNEPEHTPIKIEPAPTISPESHSIPSGLLDSQQAIATASSFQDSTNIWNSQVCGDSSPQVAVEGNPPQSSTPISGILDDILGDSSVTPLNGPTEQNNTFQQDLPQIEDEEFERSQDDMVLCPSNNDNIDQEEDLSPQSATEGQSEKRKLGQSRRRTIQPSSVGAAEAKPSTDFVDPVPLTSEAMQQIHVENFRDAVDSELPSVRSSTKTKKGKKGKKGKAKAVVERSPGEIGLSPSDYKSSEKSVGATVSAEGQESHSLTKEVMRVGDDMAGAAQESDRDEFKASLSAIDVLQAPVETVAAGQNGIQLESGKDDRGQNVLPPEELPQDELSQDSLQETTLPSDCILQEDLQTQTILPHDISLLNLARDDTPKDTLRNKDLPQVEPQPKIHLHEDSPRLNPPQDDFSQSNVRQTSNLHSDPQSNSLLVSSSSPVLAPSNWVDQSPNPSHASPLESLETRLASDEFDRELTTAISPQLELSPRAIPLPGGDDEHELLDEWLDDPILTSLGRSENAEIGNATTDPSEVSHIQDPSAITPGVQGQSQDLYSRVDHVDDGKSLATLSKEESGKGKEAEQSFLIKENGTAETQAKDGLLPDVVTSEFVEHDWRKGLNHEPATESPQGKSENVENGLGGSPNSSKGSVEEETKQNFSAENSNTNNVHEGQEMLTPLAAAEVLEDHEAMKLVDESAVNVSQPKTESSEDKWTGFNIKEKSKDGEKAKPGFSVENVKTIEIEEGNKSFSKPATFKRPEHCESLDLVDESAIHVPKAELVEEVPIDLVDNIPDQTPKPKVLEDERAPLDGKMKGKQVDKQGSTTLYPVFGSETTKHPFEQHSDPKVDLENDPSSLVTTWKSQEASADIGLDAIGVFVRDESKEAFPGVPQAESRLQNPPEGRTFGHEQQDMPVLLEPVTSQSQYVRQKARDDPESPTPDALVASTNAGQTVQVIFAGGNNVESATDITNEVTGAYAGMEEAIPHTPMQEPEIDWDEPKKKRKGKKGKKSEVFSSNKAGVSQPAESSAPHRAPDTPLEDGPAADRPSEEDEPIPDVPKKKKKDKKGKKNEVFSLDESNIMVPGILSRPSAATNPPSFDPEPTAKASYEVSSKQSKKDKKGKKGKRKGIARATSDFQDEDESNVFPTEDPQDEDKVGDPPAITMDIQQEDKPSLILTQIPQDDNKAEGVYAVTGESRTEVGPSVVSPEILQNNAQVEDRSPVHHPSVTPGLQKEAEPCFVPTETLLDKDNVDDLHADVMPPTGTEQVAPEETSKQAKFIGVAQHDEANKSREIPLGQEKDSMPPKGKKDKRKSKKLKKSNAFFPEDDEDITVGNRQPGGTSVLETDEVDRTIPSSVDVVEESDKSGRKKRLELEEDLTPLTKKGKKKLKKSRAFPPGGDVYPANEGELASNAKDLEEEAPKKTFPLIPGVEKEPETSVEGPLEDKKERGVTEEEQLAKSKEEEEVTVQSELGSAQDFSRDSKIGVKKNAIQDSGDLGGVEGNREQVMHGDFDSISAHAAMPEIPRTINSSVIESPEQPVGASEETLACHANELKGDIIPAVEPDVDPLFSLKSNENEREWAEKAPSPTWKEDEVYQEPRTVFEECSTTDNAVEPPLVPISPHSESWLKPDISAENIDASEIIEPGVSLKHDRGHPATELKESLSQAEHEVQATLEADQEDNLADVKRGTKGARPQNGNHSSLKFEEGPAAAAKPYLAIGTATKPIQGDQQASEEPPKDDMKSTSATPSNCKNPVVGSEEEHASILIDAKAIDDEKEEETPSDVPVYVDRNLESQHGKAQEDESAIDESSSSVAPVPAQETIEAALNMENVAGVSPLERLDKDELIPMMDVEMLDAKEEREYNKEYAKELNGAVSNTESVSDLEGPGNLDVDSPNISKPSPAVEVEMLDAQEQRDYNEEYAKELERQLSPLQEEERAGFSRDEANAHLFSQSSTHPIVRGPYEEEHRPLAQPPALEDIIEESGSRPSSFQGSPVDQEVEFLPVKPTRKNKKAKKGKKQQPVIWEDETATPPLDPGSEKGEGPSNGVDLWTTDTARPLDLEESVYQHPFEDMTMASPTETSRTAFRKPEIEIDRSNDYFAIQPNKPAEEDIGREDTQEFRRALAAEPPYDSEDRFLASEAQETQGPYVRDNAIDAYKQEEGLAPLAANFKVESGVEEELTGEQIKDDLDPDPLNNSIEGTEPERKALTREPSPQAPEQENAMDQPQDPETPTADGLDSRSRSRQSSLQRLSHENELSLVGEGRSTNRSKQRSIKGVAAVVDLGLGASAAKGLSRRDSQEEGRSAKKAKEDENWTGFEADKDESKSKEETAATEQERRQTPELERVWQHCPTTPPQSPSSASHNAIADHSVVRDLDPYSDSPEYRDSAIYVPSSPKTSEDIHYRRAVRDSGLPETEESPIIETERLDTPIEMERDAAAGDNVGDVQRPNSQADGTERQRSTSRNPLETSAEMRSNDDILASIQKERRKRSRRRSGVAYDSDGSTDSGSNVQRQRRRQAMAAEPREPSPVSSTSKDRSSALFDSSPTAREEIATEPQDRGLLPRHDPISEIPTKSIDREESPRQRLNDLSWEGNPDRTAEDTRASTGYGILTGHDEARGTSLFGGPQSYDDVTSPSRSPRSSEGRGRRSLNTISEDSADGSLLSRKDKRALSDVGSPESGVKGRRTRSPPVEGDVPREYVSTHDAISRQPWPAVEVEKSVVDERSRSRNSDQMSTLSSRRSAQSGVPFGQREEEHRTASAASMRSEKSNNNNMPKHKHHHSHNNDHNIHNTNTNSIHAIIQTPDQVRSASGLSYRSSGTATPPLRRVDRSASGDLRGANKRGEAKIRAKSSSESHSEHSDFAIPIPSSSTYDPVTDKGKSRADMANVYEGWGDVRGQSPMSPTRPPSMRKRQSMQLLDLETRLDQLVSENRLLASQKLTAENALQEQARDHNQERRAYEDAMQEHKAYLTRKDSELNELKKIIEDLQDQAVNLTEVNQELASSRGVDEEHEQRYNQLQDDHAHTHEQWQQTTRALDNLKEQHTQLSTGMEDIVRHEVTVALEEKNIVMRQLQSELESAKQQIRNLQQQVLAARNSDDFVERDEDYFDSRCQSLCQHVQQWVLRFSKFSDMKACYLARDIQDEKIVDRMENAILDGSGVDDYLSDRVKRRDVFMSVVMTMIWEFIFTRYLFGMDREQRQKLKNLEKTLQEVGPISAVHKWRATTLTLLMRREAFENQRAADTEAVVHEIYDTLATFLPPPSHLVGQIQDSLRKVIDAAVDLSIEMRTQRAEYSMLPPLQPEYDTNGDLARKVYFSALTMNERSGATSSNEALQEQQAVVRMVLFPLVVKNEDDDEQIVVCPAQVLTADGSKGKKTVRVLSAQGGRSEASFAGSDSRTEGGMI